MKTTLLLLFTSFALVACSQSKANGENKKTEKVEEKITPQKPTKMSNTDTEQAVKLLIDAMAAKDAKKIKESFADNASQAYGDGAAKSGTDFFKWLQSDIIGREGHVENPEYSVDGNSVVVTGQYSSIGYTNKANFLFKVENGKIISWQMRY